MGIGVIALASAVAGAYEGQSADLKDKDLRTLDRAPAVLQALTAAPDKGISRNLLEKAECVVVFPDVTKGAFVVGGEFGRGVATCRVAPNGEMGAPALFTVGGASVGWQIGGEQTDFVLLVMDRNGMDNLLRSEFKIGADASVAAGPVGRTAEASTDVLLGAQMLSWSRSQGVFAGASLEGAVIKPNDKANERLYGHPISVRDILNGNLAVPSAGRSFVDQATRLTSGTEATARRADNPSEPSSYPAHGSTSRAAETRSYVDMPQKASGTVVSVSDSQLSIETANGRRSYTINDSTIRPTSLEEGNRVSVEHSGDLVASRVTLSDSELPRTASPLPLIALIGALALFAAAALRFRSGRTA
jgi:lipid-binding SYLF domain-containing protein